MHNPSQFVYVYKVLKCMYMLGSRLINQAGETTRPLQLFAPHYKNTPHTATKCNTEIMNRFVAVCREKQHARCYKLQQTARAYCKNTLQEHTARTHCNAKQQWTALSPFVGKNETPIGSLNCAPVL